MTRRNYTLFIGLLLPLTSSIVTAEALTPPDAKPGECYARVMIPAKYETVEEKVLVKEATEEIKIIPAEYEVVEEKVMIVPETKKLIPVPAQYSETIEEVEVKPAMRVWKTSLKKRGLPVNPSIINELKTQGIDVDTVPSGTCYKEYFQAAKFKTVAEDVVVKNISKEVEIAPAEYTEENIEVVVLPPAKEVVKVPVEYETVEEKVLLEEAKTVWKKGQNPTQALSGATGEIMCLVNVPAKYKTVKKLVVKTPARTKVEEVPAEVETFTVKKLVKEPVANFTTVPEVYKTVEKKLLERPASFMWANAKESVDKSWKHTGHTVCMIETAAKTTKLKKMVLDAEVSVKEELAPAIYEVVKVEKLVTPAKEERTAIDAEYKVIEKRNKISSSHLTWQRILCQTNMTKDVISKIQDALNGKQYTAGKPDGILGRGTRIALEKFQKDNGLATGGITYETLNALNIGL